MLGASIRTRGPIFDGRANAVIGDFTEDAARAIAEQGTEDLKAATSVFKAPTGFYRSRVDFRKAGSGFVVDDSGVVYGPWLEGTSSRNRSTRFKGYKIWRQTTQRLQAKAKQIAERILPRHLRRID